MRFLGGETGTEKQKQWEVIFIKISELTGWKSSEVHCLTTSRTNTVS